MAAAIVGSTGGVGLGVGDGAGLVVGIAIVVVGVGSGAGFEHAARRAAASMPANATLEVERRFLIGSPPFLGRPACPADRPAHGVGAVI